ncbi:MAG: CotH kinase family protein [Planctomycetota bacterium]
MSQVCSNKSTLQLAHGLEIDMLDALLLIKRSINRTRGLAAIAAGIVTIGLVWQPFALAQGPGGGPDAPDILLVEKFDSDSNGFLDASERDAARSELGGRSRGGGFFGGGPGRRGGGPPGFGGRGGGPGGGSNQPGTKGINLKSDDVDQYGDEDLYDQSVLRTFFLNFDMENWESELETFKPTDVEIPCSVEVDGKVYPNVGVSFRGASSFFSIPSGSKRSFNLSTDFIDEDQRILGYKSLNFLNCNGDASLMSSLLYSNIARAKIAAPKVNFVRVVVNGENWGIYANAQQFNKDFLDENYGSRKGARWKVSGSPNGDGGLRYLGEEEAPYRERFEIKSKDKTESWAALIDLCKKLNETPADQLKEVMSPILDLDGVLWFLAADVALINSDGYWVRASDYSIYMNKDGKFHILPHDMNESFRGSHGGGGGPGGPPGFGGPGGPPGFGGGPPGGGPLGFLFGQGGRGPENAGPPQDGPNGPQAGRDGNRQSGRGGERQNGRGAGQNDRGRGERGDRSRRGGGFGGRGRGPGGGGEGGGVELSPLVGLDNDRMPLRSKLLANEELRAQYLEYVRLIASEHLNWKAMEPQVSAARNLIDRDVKRDTRKLMSYEAFQQATNPSNGSLKQFCEQRSEFLLKSIAAESEASPKP